MTYKKIEELPLQAKGLPILGQKMWMRVFNRAIRTNDKVNASKTAWQVIRQFYKLKSNRWVKRK